MRQVAKQRLRFRCKKQNSDRKKITNAAILNVNGRKYISNTVTVYNTKITEYKKFIPDTCCKPINYDKCRTHENNDSFCDVALIVAIFKLLKEMD